MENKMYCYQCQEAANNDACNQLGICGKQPKTAMLQDGLLYITKGLSEVLTHIRTEGLIIKQDVNNVINENLCMTMTNVNFNNQLLLKSIYKTLKIKKELLQKVDPSNLSQHALWQSDDENEIFNKCREVGVLSTVNEDIRSMRELITYGIKGMASYHKHATALGNQNNNIDAYMQKVLAKTLDDYATIEDLIALSLEIGQYGVKVMELLDQAHTKAYGQPEITNVNIGVRNNPAILISGHDLKDLEMLLEQTEGTGIDIYSHSEMLPAHYYPQLKKYKHFIGNYGNAWWKQTEEFEAFNGPVLVTTNCLVPPKESYKNRLYTTGAVGFSGCTHIEQDTHLKKDFSPLIEHAKKLPAPKELETGQMTGGFAHNQVLALADNIIEAIQCGAIKKFVVMAGCDGRSKKRNYYTDFAKALPKDTVILTAGCAKYKYNKLSLGDIQGIPRVLDAGQCNDSYSLVMIALKLKEVLGLEDINDLPIIYNIAWYEQKAVIVLLTLLSLGIKNIHLGPTLPAFLSPNVASVLTKKYNLLPINNTENDINKFFNTIHDDQLKTLSETH